MLLEWDMQGIDSGSYSMGSSVEHAGSVTTVLFS
jgi:hypothetical protein